MSQSELFRADGATFSPVHDGKRLSRQLDRVAAIMSDGVWRTLRGIAVQAGGSEASVSARLRRRGLSLLLYERLGGGDERLRSGH
jgi:hypothetical protein